MFKKANNLLDIKNCVGAKFLSFFLSFFLSGCSLFNEPKLTDFSFSIPRGVFSRENGTQNYKVECSLTGDINQNQIIFIDDNQTEANFTFTQIPFGAKIKIQVNVYDLLDDNKLVYEGFDNVVVNSKNNLVSIKLEKPPYLKGQGAIAKSAITIDSKTFLKTSEIVAVPKGLTAVIIGSEDYYKSYYIDSNDKYKGVFISGRTVSLSPFIIGQYEVTQELYTAVMENNPSDFNTDCASDETQDLRPVEKVKWYDTIVFCNELTKKTMTDSDCVYYSDSDFNNIYNANDANQSKDVYINTSKKGYRLLTEAEWEFAARGGDPTKPEWKYSYAGVTTSKEPSNFSKTPYEESCLEPYCWFTDNSNDGTNEITHEVGKRSPNSLGLYDMSGNVAEYCWDYYNDSVTKSDDEYKNDNIIINPLGAETNNSSERVYRGGAINSSAHSTAVSYRNSYTASSPVNWIGFRLARWL